MHPNRSCYLLSRKKQQVIAVAAHELPIVYIYPGNSLPGCMANVATT